MIKADVRVNGGETSEYPKLMVSDDGMIVLFTESEVGVCLRDPDGELMLDAARYRWIRENCNEIADWWLEGMLPETIDGMVDEELDHEP